MTCKIKVLKTCKWAQPAPSLPTLSFEKDKEYEVSDNMALSMKETGYAINAGEPKNLKMQNNTYLNKMNTEVIDNKNVSESDKVTSEDVEVSKKETTNKKFSKRGKHKKYSKE